MRIHLRIKSNNQIVPFNHQHLLTGAIHKWLGWNQEHGKVSFYSFSRLEGGKKALNGLSFEQGCLFFFSSGETSIIQKLISGIQLSPEMFCGLIVEEIMIQEDPDFSEKETFYIASPILIKRKNNNKIEHIIYTDQRANGFLKETLLTKMKQAGLSDETLDITFIKEYPKSGTKLIAYRDIKNRANWCPVIIKAKPETKAFAWNVGLGNSTGIGFGAIK